MKRMLAVLVAAVLTLGLTAGIASAAPLQLTLTDTYLVGSIVPGTGNQDDEMAWINKLITMGVGTTFTFDPGPQEDVLTRSANAFVGLPVATLGPKLNPPAPVGGIDVSGYSYIYAKYGGSGYVWYVGALPAEYGGLVVVPVASQDGTGLSHYSRYSPTTVPDGGMTLMLLGGALVGIGALRRKFRA